MLIRVSSEEVRRNMQQELEAHGVPVALQEVVCDYVYHMPVVLADCLEHPVSFALVCSAKLSFYSFLLDQPFGKDLARVLSEDSRGQKEITDLLRLNLQTDIDFLRSLAQDPNSILQEIGMDEVECILTFRLTDENRKAYLENQLKMGQLIQTQPGLIYSLNLQVFQ